MARVIVIGSTNIDMAIHLSRFPEAGETVLGGKFIRGFGGKGANQAIACKSAGATVSFLTAVGDDAAGEDVRNHMASLGLDLSYAQRISGTPTGVALIFVAQGGENRIGVASGANACLTREWVEQLPASVFDDGNVLLTGLEVPLPTVICAVERARRAGMTVIVNPAPADPALIDPLILRNIDILTPNQLELAALTGRLPSAEQRDLSRSAATLLEGGVKHVLVTLGSGGSRLYSGPPESIREAFVPPFKVDAIDTVGAGDAFNGALAAAIAEGFTLEDATQWASAAAALSVTRTGAQATHLTPETITHLIQSTTKPNRFSATGQAQQT